MNHNRFSKSKIFYSVLIFVCTVLFFSCENFLDSGDVKEAIDKAIYIANSECPVATVEPTFQDSGLPKNRSIIITFTKSMDPTTFNDNFKIEDSKENDLKEYFLEPEWYNDNKEVIIAANERHLIDLDKQDTMDIFVKLSKACTTPDGLPITSSINHKYRINKEIDNKAPEFIDISAKVPATYIAQSVSEEPRILKEGLLPVILPNVAPTTNQIEAEKEILSLNHINTKFDIYIEGRDNDKGRIRGHIKYHQLYDSMGEEVPADEEEIYVNLEKNENDDNYSGIYTIDLSDEKYSDGLYEIKVTLQDSYNKESNEVKTYNVVRDTIFAYRSNTRFGLSSPLYRIDISENATKEQIETGLREGWLDPHYNDGEYEYPTARDIEDRLNDVNFSYLPRDSYYNSKLTGENYSDDSTDYKYYVFWGLDINHLTPTPAELINPYEWAAYDNNSYWCPLPEDFHTFANDKENQNSNIIMQAKIIDGVGNDNYITILYPKKIDFHNYIVSDDDNNSEKRKVELFFEDMTKSDYTKIVNLPDRKVKPIYRIFYGKLIGEDISDSEKTTKLHRNTAVPLEEDHWSDISDLHIIENLEPDSKYVVYVQVEYKTDSMLNGQWVGETFGPLYKVIVDTSLSGSVSLEAPEFTFTKESAGVNTGLFNVTVNISNFDENVKYVPCYSTDDGQSWVYYTAAKENEFTFTVTNPLRAPFENEWNKPDWDKTYWVDEWGNDRDNGDNSYFEAVKECKRLYGYPDVTAKIKILAVSDTKTRESEVQDILFSEDDDNIPPFVTDNVTQHDSRLSYDGRYYQFENIVREDEGHLSEYFNYYYVPYQESWGDNLSIMEPEEIETLPGGVATYTSSSYYYNGAAYTIDTAIPVNGLEDGRYMFFAKVTDTYGNYAYITLGKADIGTFKNKLSVKYDPNKNMLISTLPIEGDEHFDRNMIHIQECWHEDAKKETAWNSNGYYDYLNQMQNCETKIENQKTVLQNDNSKPNINDFLAIDWPDPEDKELPGIVHTIPPRELRGNCFYRITMQSFNENPYSETTGKGVDRRYGRPYSKFDPTQPYENNQNYLYTNKFYGYVEGETEYDLCTDETVSNTVYYYIPTTAENGTTLNETTYAKDYLNDIKSSFFADTATPRSNKAYLVNVIASGRDLGNDADEWERRGKLIKSHLYYEWRTEEEYDNFNTFDSSVAANDMYESHEKGLVYYVAVVHFADGSTALSNVYTMQGF